MVARERPLALASKLHMQACRCLACTTPHVSGVSAQLHLPDAHISPEQPVGGGSHVVLALLQRVERLQHEQRRGQLTHVQPLGCSPTSLVATLSSRHQEAQPRRRAHLRAPKAHTHELADERLDSRRVRHRRGFVERRRRRQPSSRAAAKCRRRAGRRRWWRWWWRRCA